MIEVISSDSRGYADHGWLKAKHTFSFADYHDPKRIRFGVLRVINEDRIGPARGFDTHPHRDMEIITYPISGAIRHQDSMGNGTVISAGEVQRMTAGTGIQHSEFNHSNDEELHLLQIWIFPEQKNLTPGYEQRRFSRDDKLNRLRLIASNDGRDDSITVNQKVDLYAAIIESGVQLNHSIADGNKVFVQIVNGELDVGGKLVLAGDGLQISGEKDVRLTAGSESEILLFDMS